MPVLCSLFMQQKTAAIRLFFGERPLIKNSGIEVRAVGGEVSPQISGEEEVVVRITNLCPSLVNQQEVLARLVTVLAPVYHQVCMCTIFYLMLGQHFG